MTGKEYMQTQLTMVEIGKRVQALQLDAFLKCIANAETVGPVLDPTLYNKALANITAMRGLAESLLAVQQKMNGLQDAAMRTSLAYFIRGEELPKPPTPPESEL